MALAERVVARLGRRRIGYVVIDGWAVAVHHCPRSTRDLDLGVNTVLSELESLGAQFEAEGHRVEIKRPDIEDPLQGVLTIYGEGGAMVDVVNFDGKYSGFPAVIRDAIVDSVAPFAGSDLRVAPLPQLIALKLYAGGPKSLKDVQELLKNNPDADIDAIRALCKRYNVPTYGLLDVTPSNLA